MGLIEDLKEESEHSQSFGIYSISQEDYDYVAEMIPHWVNECEQECDEEIYERNLEELKCLITQEGLGESSYAPPTNHDFEKSIYCINDEWEMVFFENKVYDVLLRAAYLIDELFKMHIDPREHDHKKYKEIMYELKFLF